MNPLLVFLAGLGLLHAANGVVHRFETEAASDLAGRLEGPSKVVTVRSEVGPEVIFGEVERVSIIGAKFGTKRFPLFVEPNRSHRGNLHEFDIHLKDFSLRALHVQRLDAAIPDCRFDLAAAAGHHIFRLSESGTGRVESDVTQEDLAAFVKQKYPGLGDFRLTIDHDKVVMEGHGVFLITPADFWIAGALEPEGGTRLRLVHVRMILNGRPIDSAGADRLVSLFNPVLDLDRDLGLAGSVHVDRVELRGGVMKAFGSVTIPTEKAGGN